VVPAVPVDVADAVVLAAPVDAAVLAAEADLVDEIAILSTCRKPSSTSTVLPRW
jgi:hypothetical protein